MLKPKIIFEDQHLVVLSKPAGLLSQGEKKGDPNLVDWLRDYFGRHYVGLIHRLDRNTSGLMVVAKRSKAALRLTKALQEGQVQRAYQVWLVGRLKNGAHWKHWLVKDCQKNKVRVAAAGTPGAKQAELNVRPLRHLKRGGCDLTLAEFTLETGRSHQIRVQAAKEGFSVLGDSKYRSRKSSPDNRAYEFARPALHSCRLSFPHPMSGEMMDFTEPLPPDMRDIE